MSISLVCACKDREPSLTISLTTWLMFDEISEIIIVDWSSNKSITHLAEWDKRIKIINVPNQKYFNQPQPLNLAVDIASSKKILKLDCDHLLNPYYNFFNDYIIDEESCVCGNNLRKEDVYRGLWGLLYITKENFLKVGGYNEEMGEYYSFEDDEILLRLKSCGVKIKKIIPETHRVLHLPHPDSKRIENFKGNSDSSVINEVEKKYREELSKTYSGIILEKKISILLAAKHNELNRHVFGEKIIKEYSKVDFYHRRKYNWNIEKINSQYYLVTPKV